ncbi:phosphatase PAP2 family protein, partial [candidate division KSB1 bacterium]
IEGLIFGMQPAVEFSSILNNVFFSELFHFGYVSYFLMIPGLPFILYIKNRQEEFKQVVFGITVTFLVCYIIFIFIPVAGPRFALASSFNGEVKSILFRKIIFFIFERGAIKGAAFPSSHVAVAVCILLNAFKYHKKVFKIFLPFVICLFLGTIYGRFHYVLDSAAGALCGILLFYLGNFVYIILKKRDRQQKE